MGAGGRTAPAAAPGAPAWPAALGIAATIAGWSEDSVNAGRGRTECDAAAMDRHPCGRTPEDRAAVRNPAPRRAASAGRKREKQGRRTRGSRIAWSRRGRLSPDGGGRLRTAARGRSLPGWNSHSADPRWPDTFLLGSGNHIGYDATREMFTLLSFHQNDWSVAGT